MLNVTKRIESVNAKNQLNSVLIQKKSIRNYLLKNGVSGSESVLECIDNMSHVDAVDEVFNLVIHKARVRDIAVRVVTASTGAGDLDSALHEQALTIEDRLHGKQQTETPLIAVDESILDEETIKMLGLGGVDLSHVQHSVLKQLAKHLDDNQLSMAHALAEEIKHPFKDSGPNMEKVTS